MTLEVLPINGLFIVHKGNRDQYQICRLWASEFIPVDDAVYGSQEDAIKSLTN